MSKMRSTRLSEMEVRWVVGEKDQISASAKGEKVNDRILVRVDPTSKMWMASSSPLPRTVVITLKDWSYVQRCSLPADWSAPGDDPVPEEISYIHTMTVTRPITELIVQIVRPSNDHTSDIFLGRHLISLATPPVWMSQIRMAVSEVQAMERPSGE